jgi:glycosyltransferase involved in cell wall biosynthesis
MRLHAARGGGRWTPYRILFVVNVDWFFLSHRLPLARAAREKGAEVYVAAADTGMAQRIRDEGLHFIPLPVSRKGTNPREQARSILSLVQLYRRLRPHLVHHVTVKPVLYGSFAARLAGAPGVVNAISGLGYLFAEERRRGVLRRLTEAAYRAALRGARTRTIFQNPEDRDAFVHQGLVRKERTVLIRGSGVDCARFRVRPEPEGEPVVVLPARMLWEKGVGVFVEAARLLRARYPKARFVLVGMVDPDNPTGVPAAEIEDWVRSGVVEWWGHRTDMPEVFAEASLVALPTHYKEGLPKALLEAAACGRALIATDIPGCREIVRHGINGLLVPPQDAPALADAIASLLSCPAERARYGVASRRIAETEFAEPIVVDQTLALYGELLTAGEG